MNGNKLDFYELDILLGHLRNTKKDFIEWAHYHDIGGDENGEEFYEELIVKLINQLQKTL